MKLRFGVLIVLVALAITAVPAVAVADVYHYSGRVASAYAPVFGADAVNPELFVSVNAGDSVFKAHVPGAKVEKDAMSSADVFVDWPMEPVDGAYVRFAWLSLAPYNAGIDRKLTTAGMHADLKGVLVEGTLTAIVGEPGAFELTDAVETPITGRADLNWVGDGSLVFYRFRMQDRGFGYRIFDRAAGKYRPALVTGSLTIDGIELPADLDFTGEIAESKGMTIVHGMYPMQ